MQKTLQVMLLGMHASVLSVLSRHRRAYHLRRLEDEEASVADANERPHLIVMVGDDLYLCQQARHTWPMVPLVVVSENTSQQHIAHVLDLGADDSITIPFGEEEFLARLRAVLRRTQLRTPSEPMVDGTTLTSQDGRIVLHLAQHRCLLAGHAVHLTATQFAFLRVMLEHQEKVLTHRFLLQQVWGPTYGEESNYVRVTICQLRHKLEADPAHPRYLVTEPGVGYVFRGS